MVTAPFVADVCAHDIARKTFTLQSSAIAMPSVYHTGFCTVIAIDRRNPTSADFVMMLACMCYKMLRMGANLGRTEPCGSRA